MLVLVRALQISANTLKMKVRDEMGHLRWVYEDAKLRCSREGLAGSSKNANTECVKPGADKSWDGFHIDIANIFIWRPSQLLSAPGFTHSVLLEVNILRSKERIANSFCIGNRLNNRDYYRGAVL